MRRLHGGSETAACRGRAASLKPLQQNFGGPMAGIGVIVLFLVVMAALNRFEFGRFD
jgi:ribose/xylose/arabinose/galactoside ABC-type transport system permease subunit